MPLEVQTRILQQEAIMPKHRNEKINRIKPLKQRFSTRRLHLSKRRKTRMQSAQPRLITNKNRTPHKKRPKFRKKLLNRNLKRNSSSMLSPTLSPYLRSQSSSRIHHRLLSPRRPQVERRRTRKGQQLPRNKSNRRPNNQSRRQNQSLRLILRSRLTPKNSLLNRQLKRRNKSRSRMKTSRISNQWLSNNKSHQISCNPPIRTCSSSLSRISSLKI